MIAKSGKGGVPVVAMADEGVRIDRRRIPDRDPAQVVMGGPDQPGLLPTNVASERDPAMVSSSGSTPKSGPLLSMVSPNAAASAS